MHLELQEILRSAGTGLVDYLAPQTCLYCDQPSPRELPLCSVCRERLSPNLGACPVCALPDCGGSPCPSCQSGGRRIDRVCAPYLYEPSLAYLISRWKYHGEQRLAGAAAQLILDADDGTHDETLLLAVPMHWRRRLSRGYNQADDLLDCLLRLRPELRTASKRDLRLRRNRATPRQAGLSAAERRCSLRGAYRVEGNAQGRVVTLVDDVCTTGATAEAAAQALRTAGASRVELWCLARTPMP